MATSGATGQARQELNESVVTTIDDMKRLLTALPPQDRVIAFNEVKDWVSANGAGFETSAKTTANTS